MNPGPPSQLQLAAAPRRVCLFLSPPTTVTISGGVMAALLAHLFKYILAYIKIPRARFLYTHFRRRLNGVMRLCLSSSIPHNVWQLKCQSSAALTAEMLEEADQVLPRNNFHYNPADQMEHLPKLSDLSHVSIW